MRIYLAHVLSVEDCLKAEHTMRCRVLRPYVDYIIVVGEKLVPGLYQMSVLVKIIFQSIIRLRVVFKSILVVLRTHVVVLSERISVKIRTEIQTAHVLVAKELYAVKVVHFTFQYFGTLPQVAYRRDVSVVAVAVHGLDARALMCFRVFKNIHSAKTFFTEVLTYDGYEEVKMFLILEFCHLFGKIIQLECFVF